MTLFPTRGWHEAEIRRYNERTEREYIDIRDFLVLHYTATERDDSALWDYCRNLAPPDGLREKLEMFRSSGRVFREHEELFTETSWLAALVGHRVPPGGYHPVADMLPDAETLDRLAHIRQVVAYAAGQMPTQEQFLAANGSAIDASLRLSA
jgi:tryptophan halogenase